MAVTLGKVNTGTVSFVTGDRLAVTVDIALDSAYPTNGYPLAASAFGFTELDYVNPTSDASGKTYAYDYVNSKLKAFSAGVEVSNGTSLSSVTVRTLAIGKGFPISGVY